MISKFKELNTDKQVMFLLLLSDSVSNILTTSANYGAVKTALKACWDWVEDKKYSADDIYNLLDDGTEETGLFMLMQDETDETKELAFGCIVDAVSYTNWKAFQYEGQEYLPAPIENVDENILEQFLDGLYQITDSYKTITEGLITFLLETQESGIQETLVVLEHKKMKIAPENLV